MAAPSYQQPVGQPQARICSNCGRLRTWIRQLRVCTACDWAPIAIIHHNHGTTR